VAVVEQRERDSSDDQPVVEKEVSKCSIKPSTIQQLNMFRGRLRGRLRGNELKINGHKGIMYD
jgi:hypothetical protein